MGPAADARAAAAPVVRDCVADVAVRGCRALSAGSLRGASSLAVSPDATRVYVAAYGAGQLLAFRRGGRSRLALSGCVADDGSPGCAAAPSYALAGSAGVAVSPSGADVYLASGLGRAVLRLRSATSGPPVYGSCVADFGAFGCADPATDALAGASAVAVGPGGRDVYVTSFDGAAVSHLRRGADGSLTLAGCVADVAAFGCAGTPGNVLEGASGVAVAPGGRHVYVTSFRSGSISRFVRRADGSLRYRDCVADRAANGCARVTVDSLVGATGLALSPDGKRLYVAAQVGVVSAFARSASSGALRFAGCVGRDGKRGCARPAADSLAGAAGVAVRGREVYVAAQRAGAITRLKTGRRGRLAFATCVSGRRVRGCRRGPAGALNGVYALAARGRDLYAASPTAASVTRLRLPAR